MGQVRLVHPQILVGNTISPSENSFHVTDQFSSKVLDLYRRLDGLVVMARSKALDPIPNSTVKILSADGTPS